MVLGKEKASFYKNKLNFIGGKIDKAQGSKKAKLVWTLYDEVREELGIHLAYRPFAKSFIHNQKVYKQVNRIAFKTMLYFCCLSGIDTGRWQTRSQKREGMYQKNLLGWEYVEMSELAYVPLEGLATRTDCSLFVKENIGLIKAAAAEAINRKPLSINTFPKVQDDVPMLGDENR